jgi:hypothetical protein
MKIRHGFVSNSSSSSFCIFGIYVNKEELLSAQELLNKGLLKEEDFKYKCWKEDPSEYISKIGLTVDSMPDDYDKLYIGNEWTSVKDDETGSQFKERTINALKQVIKNPDKIKAYTYQEAWYNG